MTELLAWAGAALSTAWVAPGNTRAPHEPPGGPAVAAAYWLTLANAAVWAAWASITGHLAAGVSPGGQRRC